MIDIGIERQPQQTSADVIGDRKFGNEPVQVANSSRRSVERDVVEGSDHAVRVHPVEDRISNRFGWHE